MKTNSATPIKYTTIQRDNKGAMVDFHDARTHELVGSVLDSHADYFSRAVNSHDEVVNTLEWAKWWLEGLEKSGIIITRHVVNQMETALRNARAEG